MGVGNNATWMGPGPSQWIVVWGQPGRSNWRVERVTAFDDGEARVRALELHPELGRPIAAFLARPEPGIKKGS